MVSEFLQRRGMSPEGVDFAALKRKFAEAMPRSALAADPRQRTYLRPPESGLRGGAVVLDAGGTRLRAARAEFSPGGARVLRLGERAVPGTDREVTAAEFFGETADFVLPFLGDTGRLGFCFSYVATPTPEGDARIEGVCKELRLRGAEGLMAGEGLGRALAARGRENVRIRLVNDSSAVLLGGMTATGEQNAAALILGTGMNIACVADSELINLEAGTFADCPRGDADRAVDAASAVPGDHLLEKMVSGAYLIRVLAETLRLARADGAISEGELEAGLAMGYPEADALCRRGEPGALGEIFAALFDRAAKLTAAAASAALERTGAGALFAEGSTYEKNGTLRRAFEGYMGGGVKIYALEDAALLGAAAAAMAL